MSGLAPHKVYLASLLTLGLVFLSQIKRDDDGHHAAAVE